MCFCSVEGENDILPVWMPVPWYFLMVFFFSCTTDAATELQVSNSKLAEVEAAFAAQKSEVFVHFLSHFSHESFWLVAAGKAFN